MRIAQYGNANNSWTFIKLVGGAASSPVHFLKIQVFKEAARKGSDRITRYPFAYSVDGETYYGTCEEK
jgi:hypothetical protein